MDYDSAVEHALEIGEDPEDYLRRIEKRTPRASSQMERLCGLEETDPLQRLLERTWNAIQKSGVAILLLLVLCGVSRADSLSIVTQDLTQGSVLPLLDDVAEDMAENLLAAQLAAPYTQWESDSLQLSINSVLKAIGLEQSWGATYCDDLNCSIAWLQSTVAIDDGAQLSLSPTSINFGDVPISTPEPSTLLLLLPVLIAACLAIWRRDVK
jgi:hypothetical protein